MNTREIEYFLSSNEEISKISHGVYAADMLPKHKIEKLPQIFVINTCSSEVEDFKNCHWICIHLTAYAIEYFDSAGHLSFLANEHIAKFVLTQEKKIIFNCQQVQDITSDKCGYFCLAFLNYVAGFHVDFSTFMEVFDRENLKLNDDIVMKLFRDAYIQ